MNKSTSNGQSSSIGLSPISRISKHKMTPLRTKRKTSRKDQGADVHTTCSTPNRPQSDIQCYGFNSPSDSFPYSQDGRPDVVWDYTSPKLPKGCKKKEIKITVDEFLKNLNHHQAPECNTQTSNYIKLLEKWMTKQNSPVHVMKPPKNMTRDNKKRSRRVIEEIKEFMESIQKKDENSSAGDDNEYIAGKNSLPKPESSKCCNVSLNKKSFLEGDDKNDSTDELWGEVDNSFIIKATQHLDATDANVLDKKVEIMSTIPETLASTSKEPSICETELSGERRSFKETDSDSDQKAQILLTQIMNFDWDSGSDDDWDNGFIVEDDALSLIPDEALYGSDPQQDEISKQTVIKISHERLSPSDVQPVESNSDNKVPYSKNRSEEISFGYSESDKVASQTGDTSNAELFTNFEDESFGDESILCKPEVLSWMDEIESKLSQSQRCTPEEIEKKKDEAIERRRRRRSKSKCS